MRMPLWRRGALHSRPQNLMFSEVLPSLTCPILTLRGENDRVMPLADHYEMARLPPQAKLVVGACSGHMTPLENPEALTRALREWLLEW